VAGPCKIWVGSSKMRYISFHPDKVIGWGALFEGRNLYNCVVGGGILLSICGKECVGPWAHCS
jgi:hypothetical protein